MLISSTKTTKNLMRTLLLFMLVVFCTPFTIFEEANTYLADTESELVHYYLTPLPDNSEASMEIFVLSTNITATFTTEPEPGTLVAAPASVFFHPPE